MRRWFSWRHADLALAGLVAVATVFAVAGLLLSGRGLEAALALVVTICLRTLTEALTHGADLSRLTVLVPFALGALLAAGEAVSILYGNWRLTNARALTQRPPPPRLARLAARCDLGSQLVFVESPRPLAFTQAVRRPRVWISAGLLSVLDDEELEAVLRHEAHHRQARDPLKVLVARCLRRGLFFVPVAKSLCDAYCGAKELAADAHAVETMGSALPLARALHKLLSAPAGPVVQPNIADNPSLMEARLLALLSPEPPPDRFRVRHVGLSLGWLLLLLATAVAPSAEHLPALTECVPTDL